MTITNLALADTGDLALTTNSSGFVWIADLDAIAQDCATRLRLLRGEWLLDTDAGLDLERVTGAGITNQGIESEVRRVLGSVTGITSVVSVTVTRTGRAAAVSFEALADTGALITGSVEV